MTMRSSVMSWVARVAAVVCLGGAAAAAAPLAAAAVVASLAVPVIKQSGEQCGPASLEMVMRYYGAGPEVARQPYLAYDPALRGSLITELAAVARRAGYQARVATLEPDSLIALLDAGVPPIVLYQSGRRPLTVLHYAVVTGWDRERETFVLNDGAEKPRLRGRDDLEKRWRKAGSQALIVWKTTP